MTGHSALGPQCEAAVPTVMSGKAALHLLGSFQAEIRPKGHFLLTQFSSFVSDSFFHSLKLPDLGQPWAL